MFRNWSYAAVVIILIFILSGAYAVAIYESQDKEFKLKDEAWREAIRYSEKMVPYYREHARTDFYNGYLQALRNQHKQTH